MAVSMFVILGVHAVAMAGVLAMANVSRQLVDAEGRAVEYAWAECRVPASRAATRRR